VNSLPPRTPTVATTGPNVRPGEKPPVLSALGRENSRAGSILFATYWMQTIDWAYATTDSHLARSVYAGTCSGCARFLRITIDDVRSRGRHFEGGRIGVTGTTIQPNDRRSGSTSVVDVTVSQAALRVVDAAGVVRERTPPSNEVVFRTWLRWSHGVWTVVDWKHAVQG
jgi:hypothetical protein